MAPPTRGYRRGMGEPRTGTVSVPKAVTVEDDAHLTDAVWRNAEQRPDRRLLAWPTDDGWRDIDCAAFRDEVVRTAQALIAAGVRAGDRVALMSRTRYEWTLVDYAVLACGAVTVPVYPTAGEQQLAWILQDAEPTVCVVETRDQADQVRAITGVSDRVWCLDDGDLARLDPGPVRPEEVADRRRRARADDLATIVYTSGTTGRPKGCMLTHRNLLAEVGNAVARLDFLFRAPDAATLLFLPLAHAFARLVQFGCLHAGARLGLLPDPRQAAGQLPVFRPTFLLAAPRMFEKIHEAAQRRAGGGMRGAVFRRADAVAVAYSRAQEATGGPGAWLELRHRLYDRLVYRALRRALGGRCTAAVSGGAPLSERLVHFFRGAGLPVYEGYGLTETSPAVTVNSPDATRVGTVGRPLPGVSVRTADTGEILVRGDVVFAGYWRDPAATAQVLDADGWLRTGDLGRLDDDGFLTVTGRIKEQFVTAGGKSVSPAVLEERLRTHPLISQAVVVGDRRPFVAALVTLDEEALPEWLAEHGRPPDATAAEVRDDPALRKEVADAVAYANRAVSRAESIREFRILPGDFNEQRGELTPTMKVSRGVVQKEYAEEIEAIYRR